MVEPAAAGAGAVGLAGTTAAAGGGSLLQQGHDLGLLLPYLFSQL